MKSLSLVLFFMVSFKTYAKVICSDSDLNAAVRIARSHSPNSDKNMHCTVSCMLGLKCSWSSVMAMGYLKEFQDVFGTGNAEWGDLKADRIGADLAYHGRAKSNRECLQQCDNYYKP